MSGADRAVDLARLVLTFGRVPRATLHPDGEPESVVTHTVMLALWASALAEESDNLDAGLVARFAMIHDLVETYAGDTDTARALNDVDQAKKDAREKESLARIHDDLAGFPGLVGADGRRGGGLAPSDSGHEGARQDRAREVRNATQGAQRKAPPRRSLPGAP